MLRFCWKLLSICAIPAATLALAASLTAAPVLLDDRFELPSGCHIYRAADAEMTGGSYAMTFDGQGRLLVGDGAAVRRLSDRNGDGVFDDAEVIATGLGPRGPQGLLVFGDRLYAVGGDGLQLFEGYASGGPLVHRGRLGAKFRTGGDHDAHTVLRGHDGWLYFMVGNGAGTTGRAHVTEESSPARIEREACVFRVSPDGRRWECLGTGGRNPPSLGLHALGDLFSHDSDMEWHVGLPWYRPTRLNHWLLGADQGWHDVGAARPWHIDTLPGVLDTGRGSPNWGVFYEHRQLPQKYRDAFLVCDYRWKQESRDRYATSGRLVAFFLRRQGAGWQAAMETVAQPRPGARDSDGRPIHFALVDVAVAPDGSLLLSEHNQGVWRIYHDGVARRKSTPPPLLPAWSAVGDSPVALLNALLELPQPGAEHSRLREVELRGRLGASGARLLKDGALDGSRPLAQRLRAVRLLAPDFERLPAAWLESLARDSEPELRGQAAWLLGLRGGEAGLAVLLRLLEDTDSFVRRRAAEAFNRQHAPEATLPLVARLADPERLVRHAAMTALSHQPASTWLEAALARPELQPRLRALVALAWRGETNRSSLVRRHLPALLDAAPAGTEDKLDLLRVLAIHREVIQTDATLAERLADFLVKHFPDAHRDVRWEQARLMGEFRVARGFGPLARALASERDPVTQFHFAQALARLPGGGTAAEESRALRWFLRSQRGWFAEFDGKGVEFPGAWAAVLADFAGRHREAVLRELPAIDLAGQLGGAALALLAEPPSDGKTLIDLYRKESRIEARRQILLALRPVPGRRVESFLTDEFNRLDWDAPEDARLRGMILEHWAERPTKATLASLIYEGLFHEDAAVVRASARGVLRGAEEARALFAEGTAPSGREPQEELAVDLISRMMERPDLFHALEAALVVWSGRQRPGYKAGQDFRARPAEGVFTAGVEFWKGWYAQAFKKPFQPQIDPALPERSDEEVHRFLLGRPAKGGNASRGARLYESLQCQSCHGGGVTPGREERLFGPDLAGVTRRLTRRQLADALVYPSREVADRFKGVEVTLKEGAALTGFITAQDDGTVTLAARDQAHRLDRGRIESIAPQTVSLMPERLLNRLTWEELRDLLAFLDDPSAARE
jgi:putative heme-binding domain-containing protein